MKEEAKTDENKEEGAKKDGEKEEKQEKEDSNATGLVHSTDMQY